MPTSSTASGTARRSRLVARRTPTGSARDTVGSSCSMPSSLASIVSMLDAGDAPAREVAARGRERRAVGVAHGVHREAVDDGEPVEHDRRGRRCRARRRGSSPSAARARRSWRRRRAARRPSASAGDVSVFSVEAGSTMPLISLRGSAHSVTSQPPERVDEDEELVVVRPAASAIAARAGSAGERRRRPRRRRGPSRNVRRDRSWRRSSVQVELGVADEAVTDGRPAGLGRA